MGQIAERAWIVDSRGTRNSKVNFSLIRSWPSADTLCRESSSRALNKADNPPYVKLMDK